MNSLWRHASILGVGLVLASCGGHDGAVAPLPAAPSAPSSSSNGSGYFMASSQGLAPEGFEFRMKLDPRPGEDGIIREGSPVTVDIDLCGSTPDAGKTLHFLFDLDFNDLAEVVGTGDTCHQKHTYRVPKDATKDIVLESNVCVTNGDPGVHDGSTYFSCRVVRVALPKPAQEGSCTPGAGAPGGCLNLVSPADGAASVNWDGGTGPDLSFGFEGPDCQDEIGDAIIVWACSQAEAEALCTGAEFSGGVLASGQRLYFCPEDTLQAGQANPGTGIGRWTKALSQK